MIAAPPTTPPLQPLAFVPPAADWRTLLSWIHEMPPPAALDRGRPDTPACGAEPVWLTLSPMAPTIPRWTLTWDPEVGFVGTLRNR